MFDPGAGGYFLSCTGRVRTKGGPFSSWRCTKSRNSRVIYRKGQGNVSLRYLKGPFEVIEQMNLVVDSSTLEKGYNISTEGMRKGEPFSIEGI